MVDRPVLHEAWNDSDEVRVLIMAEVPMPLPLNVCNHVAQRMFRFFPTFRGLTDRVHGFAVDDHERIASDA